jgi:hypothetical protein
MGFSTDTSGADRNRTHTEAFVLFCMVWEIIFAAGINDV